MRELVGLFVLALAMEALRLSLFARMPVHPDFLMGVVVLVALSRPAAVGALVGFLLGFIRGIVYGEPPGLEAFPLTLLGWGVGSLGRSVYRDAVLTQAVVLFLAGMAKGTFVFVVQHGGDLHGLPWYLLRICLLSSILTAVTVPFLYSLAKQVFEHRGSFVPAMRGWLRTYEKKLLVKRQ